MSDLDAIIDDAYRQHLVGTSRPIYISWDQFERLIARISPFAAKKPIINLDQVLLEHYGIETEPSQQPMTLYGIPLIVEDSPVRGEAPGT